MNAPRIAVLIPCYNEESTISETVRDFRKALPRAVIHVYDNNSTDDTARVARKAGARVTGEPLQGKGHVIRSMFREVEADVYVMVDGDRTYPAESVHELLAPVLEGRADMAVGDRHSNESYRLENKRPFHQAGNALIPWLINRLWHADLRDVMSGYRAFNRRFVKQIAVLTAGFEVETELTLNALDARMRIVEIPVRYRDRPAGSFSKLHTFRDGWRILVLILAILKDYRPLFFFGLIAAIFALAGSLSGAIPVVDFLRFRFVYHVPLAILATGLGILSMISLSIGLVLDTLTRQHRIRTEISLKNG
ncbi:MAG: glycosyltransferase [Spirochaetes bacterium]|nr:glycosyltransferase [Spirochaetota bacterium]